MTAVWGTNLQFLVLVLLLILFISSVWTFVRQAQAHEQVQENSPVFCSCAYPYLVYFFSVNIRETNTNNFIVSLVNCVRVFLCLSRVCEYSFFMRVLIFLLMSRVWTFLLYLCSRAYLTCVDNSSLCMFLYLCLSHACELNIHSLCLYLCLSHKCEPCLKI